MRGLVFLGLLVVAASVSGCSTAGARVFVSFDSEPVPRATATTFEVIVRDRAGMVAGDLVYSLVPDPVREQTMLPFDLTLEPRDGDASATYELEGRLIDVGGTIIATQRARGGYVEGEGLELRLVFDDLCANAICAETETCQNGDCYERCVIPTPIGALGDRRSPPLTCPESPTCVDGEPPTCVPHGTGFGVHTCEQTVPGEPLVHVIRHCDGACDTSSGVADCVP